MCMKRFAVLSTFVAVLLVTAAIAAQAPQGQGGAPQLPPPKNLTFFAKDMTNQQLLTIMQDFNAALVVNCAYCHVMEPPLTNPKNDFASDEKEPKKAARVMLQLARDVNMKLQSDLGKPAAQLTNVQCVTCHRGVAIPKQLVTIMTETTAKEGVNKALQQYQELRKKYYGA